jgi:hypothetical protein
MSENLQNCLGAAAVIFAFWLGVACVAWAVGQAKPLNKPNGKKLKPPRDNESYDDWVARMASLK